MQLFALYVSSLDNEFLELKVFDSAEKAKAYCKEKFHLIDEMWGFNEKKREYRYYGAPRKVKYMPYDNILIYCRDVE